MAEITIQTYLDAVPEERKEAFVKLRNTILENLPKGFQEIISYGMIGYVVPHTSYPVGYHCDPSQPLPFLNIANQKSNIAIYHMGIYAQPELLKWFQDEYPKHSTTKLDMGKSCIRFKNPDKIPYELIGQLAAKMTPEEWVKIYEAGIRK